MTTRGQTHAKRARELAQQERRERKRAKKAEAAAQRAGKAPAADGSLTPDPEGQVQPAASEWIR
jgi:hypothetical protein